LDEGATWTKFEGNPVLKNPGIRDFRDPKVSWHEGLKKWIITLGNARLHCILFIAQPEDWTRESEFGKDVVAHGGVWECPDLFPLEHNGETVWVLLVSINSGGPNGGSATQYFPGRFDGRSFAPYATDTRWIDYGTDNYAGITWSNTGKRKIFLGWMSNWQYANVVPTERWRSATTIPRDLSIEKVGERYVVRSVPSPELNAVAEQPVVLKNITGGNYDLTAKVGQLTGPARVQIRADTIKNFSLTLSNASGENVVLGYERNSNSYFIDRTASGKPAFDKGFAKRHYAPRLTSNAAADVTLIIDNASVELFADGGLTVMTSIFFPTTLLTNITLQTAEGLTINSLQ
jgi:fructan beta-fructosidase